ncbi:hypothetical protein EC988_004455, partial [Linderina pennispora]
MQVAPDDSWLVVVGKDTFTKRSKSQCLLALFKADGNGQLVSARPGLPDVYSFTPNSTDVILYVTADFGRKIQQLKMHRFGDEHLSNVAATWSGMELPFGGLCGLYNLNNKPDPKNKGIPHVELSTHLQEFHKASIDMKEQEIVTPMPAKEL